MTTTRPASLPPIVSITKGDDTLTAVTTRCATNKAVDVRGAFVRRVDVRPDGNIQVALYSKFMHGRAGHHRIPAEDGSATVLTIVVTAYHDTERAEIVTQLDQWSKNNEALMVIAAPSQLGAIVDINDTAIVFNTNPTQS